MSRPLKPTAISPGSTSSPRTKCRLCEANSRVPSKPTVARVNEILEEYADAHTRATDPNQTPNLRVIYMNSVAELRSELMTAMAQAKTFKAAFRGWNAFLNPSGQLTIVGPDKASAHVTLPPQTSGTR